VSDHEWIWFERPGPGAPIQCCRSCGVVKRRDGKNNPCRGPVRVAPRSSPTPNKTGEQ